MPGKCALLILIWLAIGPLASAADGDNEKLYAAIRDNDLRGLTALLDRGADPNAADARKRTPLVSAAAIGPIEAMKVLVAHKADVNARDASGSTALTWSARDLGKVRFLLDNGADPNPTSPRGPTALMIAAGAERSVEIVRALLDKGADIKASNGVGHTALHAAANAGNLPVLSLLLEKELDINARTREPSGGFTPLILASQTRNTECRFLIAKGADVNAATPRDNPSRVKNGAIDVGGITALMVAASLGPPSLVKSLLDAGAGVNAQDIRGMTPLMLAIATDHQNPQIIRMLLSGGANKDIRSREGETALALAHKTGAAAGIELLGGTVPELSPVQPSLKAPDLRIAVERGTKLLEATASSGFLASGGCFACHAQPASQFAAVTAGHKGIPVNQEDTEKRRQLLGTVLESGTAIGAGGEALLFAIESFQREARVPEKTGDFLAASLLFSQREDGSWRGSLLPRTPIQDDDFTTTALSLRALSMLSAPAMKAEAARRIEKAKDWLIHAEPVTIENRAMCMLGMAAAGVNSSDVQKTARSILERQRSDGGWAQRDELASDAYATGFALWALADAGLLKPGDPAFQRGVRFLLSTQAQDGSWHVASRAVIKVQPYFESGFPYGEDQWISSMATGWATSVLALALDGGH